MSTPKESAPRNFLDLHHHDLTTLRYMLERARVYKRGGPVIGGKQPFKGRTLAMIFEKSSTRTRVSFEVGMKQLGGEVVLLDGTSSQLGRGETVADTARVLSRYVDAIMMRTDAADKLQEMAHYASVPVINGLSDDSHPCQLMADVMTFEEHRGTIAGKTVAWVGDGNNVAASWVHAAVRFGFKLRVATPDELKLPRGVVEWSQAEGGDLVETADPQAAVEGADLVVTDCWVSMGDPDGERRHNLLTPYRVDKALMRQADRDALFMHCLPAHRGEEVTDEVMDGPQSVVWDEAENRLHAQKGVLFWCLSG